MKAISFHIPKTENASFRVQEDRLPRFYDLLHAHPEVQLTLILRGKGLFSIGNQFGPFSEGQVYLIGAHVPHVFHSDPHETGVHAISLFFHREAFGPEFFQLPEWRGLRQLLRASRQGVRLQAELARELALPIEGMLRQSGARRIIQLLDLLDRIAGSGAWQTLSPLEKYPAPNESDFQRISHVFNYIVANYQRDITLPEIAGEVFLSPAAFSRFFKKRTRKSFVTYLNEYRIGKACQLLLNTPLPVRTICYQTGFSNLANFNRRFKAVMGVTPSVYRKRFP